MTKTKASNIKNKVAKAVNSKEIVEVPIESKLVESNAKRPKGKRPPTKPLKIDGIRVVEISPKVIHTTPPSTPYTPLTTQQISEIRKNLIKNSDRQLEVNSDTVSTNDDKIANPVNEAVLKNTSSKQKPQKRVLVNQNKKSDEELNQVAVDDNSEISNQSGEAASELDMTVEPSTIEKKKRNNKRKNKKKTNPETPEVVSVEVDVKEEQLVQNPKDQNLIKRSDQNNLAKASQPKGQKNKKPEPQTAKSRPAPPKRVEILYSTLPTTKELSKSQLANTYLSNFLGKVEDYLSKEAFIEPGGKLLLAVSGGVDSVVLMDSLAILAHKMRFTLYIAHYNHKLRGFSSDRDETLVRNTSKEYNLNFYSSSGNVKQYSSKNSLSIEHAARILRYNFFERTARNVGVDIVATAHTEDDLVETFLINLLRGSGLTGLSSMPSKRKFVKNVSLVRPFLQFSKKDLYEYASIRKLKWFEDETNSLLNYTRNKVRHDLIPKLINEYNPAVIEVISRTTELIQGADEVIKDIVVKSITNVIDEANNERFSLKINMLLTFNKFMQGELIQYSWNKYFRLQPLPLSAIDRILELNNSQTGSICEISSGYFVLRDRNNLIFAKKIKEITTSLMIEKPGEYKIGKLKLIISEVKPEEVVFSDDKNIEYISAEFMEPFIEIRNKREGDVFHPLGSPGEMKLSDFLTNEKVPLVDKANILIMTNKMQILWVMGHRISEKCRIKKTEAKIYKLKLVNSDKK